MKDAVILNAGSGAWAFEELGQQLSRAFGVPLSEEPAAFNYVLAWESKSPPSGQCFVPFDGIEVATDKRFLASTFAQNGVPTPQTYLLDSVATLNDFLLRERNQRWLLKWPTGCGASGHRFVVAGDEIVEDWPLPFVVQEFIPMERPEVFRLYAVAGETFGWNARRFAGEAPSVFVAHAQGARYEEVGKAPDAAIEVARRALEATNLWNSFGCADLLRDAHGNWLALEVNTDGRWMHVDRDVSLPGIVGEIETRLAAAFQNWVSVRL